MARAIAPLLIATLLATPSGPAAAQVRRCELPTGGTVYTDRRCDELGATERRIEAAQPRLRSHRAACPRTLRDLAFEVSASIESQDANRLAGVYHWTGMSSKQAFSVMDRLQTIVDRSLVDLQPVYPGGGDDPYATLVPRRPPVALRVEQVAENGSTPVRTTFGLRKHLGCWWIVQGGGTASPSIASDARAPGARTD